MASQCELAPAAAPPSGGARAAGAPGEPGHDFVGRGPEMAEVCAALDGALASRGSVLLVTGEAGLGKTRLAQEASAHAAARGLEVAWGRAHEWSSTASFWPWARLLEAHAARRARDEVAADLESASPFVARIAPGLYADRSESDDGAGDDGARDRARLFAGVARYLRRAALRAPALLVLDDLHWADAGSLRLLEVVATSAIGSPIALLVTCREEEAAHGSEGLAQTLAALVRLPHAKRIHLTPLLRDDVAMMIRASAARMATPDVAEAVLRRTRGNPFFIGELLRLWNAGARDAISAAREVPRSVRAVIRRRLAHLPERCRDALAAAAVVGEDFSLDVIEATAGLRRDALLAAIDRALEARLLVRDPISPTRWSFAHSLVRDALYAELGSGARAALHRATAERLEELHAGDAEAVLDRLAYHFHSARPAGAAGKAMLYAARAARAAAARFAYEDAVVLYERALDALEATPDATPRTRTEFLLGLGEALWRSGQGERARAELRRAAALATRAAAPDLLARAALRFRGGQFLLTRPPDPENAALLAAARSALGDGDPELAARVAGKLALEYLAAGDLAAHDALSADAVASARRAGNAATLASVLIGRHWGLLGGVDLTARLALADEAARTAQLAGAGEKEATAHLHRIVDLLELGDLAAVRRTLADPCAEARQPQTFRYLRALARGRDALLRGDLAEGERAVEALAQLACGREPLRPDQDGAWAVFAQTYVLRREQGRLVELDPQTRALVAERGDRITWPLLLALLHAESGRLDAARALYAEAATGALRDPVVDGVFVPTMALLCELAARFGDPEVLARLDELLSPYRGRSVMFGFVAAYWGCTSYYLGLVAEARGLRAAALRYLDEARAFDATLGARPWLVRDDVAIARLRGAAGSAVAWPRRGPPPPTCATARAEPAAFRRDGDVWTLSYGGQVVRLHDARGLGYLAVLLTRGGERVHALDLLAGATPRATAGNAGEARAPSRSGAAAERARTAVKHRIRDALRRIAERHPALADHLATRVRTGVYCAYRPDPARPIAWAL